LQVEKPIFNVPKCVLWSIGIILAVHLYQQWLSNQEQFEFILSLAFIPVRYSDTVSGIPGGEISKYTSFLTYMFIHGDWVHLLVNSLWLLAFGSAVAKRIGDLRYVIFSLLCGVAGVLTHLFVHWGDVGPVVGASAAISGQMAGAIRFIFGAYKEGQINVVQFNPQSTPLIGIGEAIREPRIIAFLVVWISLNIFVGIGGISIGKTANIAWEAHIGGFLAGLMLFGLFDRVTPAINSTGTTEKPVD